MNITSILTSVLGLGSILLDGDQAQAPILKDLDLLDAPSSNLMLTMMDDPFDSIFAQISSQTFQDIDSRNLALATEFRKATAISQAPVLKVLSALGVTAKSYWIVNKIFVENATPLVVSALMKISLLKEIAKEILVPLVPAIDLGLGTPPAKPEWSVEMVGAPKVWNMNRTSQGEGIIIARVRGTHEALKNNYMGTSNDGWSDPIAHMKEPIDLDGHGTHTCGTCCGSNGIGVAPRAKWRACVGCTSITCPENALLSCGQWAVCPKNDPNGNPVSCTNRAHIISCSWGGSGGQPFYNGVIQNWNKFGTIGIFAAGNSGPDRKTGGSPGDQPGVISVGSTNDKDAVSDFSSRGPRSGTTIDNIFFPAIVAPGEDINSASNLGDRSYRVLSGTSMATPNAAGCVALLMGTPLGKAMTLESIQNLLCSTANRQLTLPGTNCGTSATAEGSYPNNVAGCGRVDVAEAVQQLMKRGENVESASTKA